MQVTHGGFHCEVGTKRSGNAVKQNRLLEDESLQEDGIFLKGGRQLCQKNQNIILQQR